jgi:hypothetical protein
MIISIKTYNNWNAAGVQVGVGVLEFFSAMELFGKSNKLTLGYWTDGRTAV